MMRETPVRYYMRRNKHKQGTILWLGVRVWFNPLIDVVWNGREFTKDFISHDDKDRKR